MEQDQGPTQIGDAEAGGTDPELTVARLKEVYLKAADRDVTSLETQLARLLDNVAHWPDACLAMRKVSHDIKGQGASFGYPLMSEVGHSLSQLLNEIETIDPPSLDRLAAHVAALRRVLEEDIEGEGDALGESLTRELAIEPSKFGEL